MPLRCRCLIRHLLIVDAAAAVLRFDIASLRYADAMPLADYAHCCHYFSLLLIDASFRQRHADAAADDADATTLFDTPFRCYAAMPLFAADLRSFAMPPCHMPCRFSLLPFVDFFSLSFVYYYCRITPLFRCHATLRFSLCHAICLLLSPALLAAIDD